MNWRKIDAKVTLVKFFDLYIYNDRIPVPWDGPYLEIILLQKIVEKNTFPFEGFRDISVVFVCIRIRESMVLVQNLSRERQISGLTA